MVFWTPWDQIGTKWEEEEEVVWLLAGCVSGLAGRPGCQFVLSGLVVCLLAGYVPGRLGRLASRPRRAGSLAGWPHRPARLAAGPPGALGGSASPRRGSVTQIR